MSTSVAEIEKLAMNLGESDRARLASRLFHSLPPVAFDEDGGVAEARRRDREMDRDPSRGMSVEELDELIANRRK
jgi:putative addiction module component (TIGR02574 family)